ncbi:MAG: hypothetical protein WBA93_17290 [Microcoleaceae cyanobacterium]
MRFHLYFSSDHLFVGIRKCLSCIEENYTQHWYICLIPVLTIQISYDVEKPNKDFVITELY